MCIFLAISTSRSLSLSLSLLPLVFVLSLSHSLLSLSLCLSISFSLSRSLSPSFSLSLSLALSLYLISLSGEILSRYMSPFSSYRPLYAKALSENLAPSSFALVERNSLRTRALDPGRFKAPRRVLDRHWSIVSASNALARLRSSESNIPERGSKFCVIEKTYSRIRNFSLTHRRT